MKKLNCIYFRKGEIIKNVKICQISKQKTPIVRIEGKVIFVPNPNLKLGDTIDIKIKNDGKRFSFAEVCKNV